MSNPPISETLSKLGDGCVLIGEYRAGYAGMKEWVDKEDGKRKSRIDSHILVEMVTETGAQSAKLYLNPPSTVTDPAQIKFPWKKGQRYAFPIRGLKSEKGAISGSLDDRREVLPI